MKTFDVNGDVVNNGIPVSNEPYPHIVLGSGGHKRATWVALGKNDATMISEGGVVRDAGVIALKDAASNLTGKFLIVAPRNGSDNRALVLWRVSSGYRGSASVKAGEEVTVIASDQSWHSGRGSLGSTAEMLAILKPGQELTASISGRRVQKTRARLTWDGQKISVVFGGDDLDIATTDKVDGEYL